MVQMRFLSWGLQGFVVQVKTRCYTFDYVCMHIYIGPMFRCSYSSMPAYTRSKNEQQGGTGSVNLAKAERTARVVFKVKGPAGSFRK